MTACAGSPTGCAATSCGARPAPAGGAGMRVALVNPNWSFDGSIYFGCREPHLPLELGWCRVLLEAEGTPYCSSTGTCSDWPRATSAPRSPRSARPRRRHHRADLPVLALRAARAAGPARAGPSAPGVAPRIVAVGPARLDHAGRRLAQARRRRRRHGRVRGGGRAASPAVPGTALRASPVGTATRSLVNGGPQATLRRPGRR